MPHRYVGFAKSARNSENTRIIPDNPVSTPSPIIQLGISDRFIDRLIKITITGMVEQMMAASPLGTTTSAQDTRPLPQVIIRNPRKACIRSSLSDGNLACLTRRKKPHKINPAVIWRRPAKRKGGNFITPIRITKNVVPQIRQIPARHRYAIPVSFFTGRKVKSV